MTKRASSVFVKRSTRWTRSDTLALSLDDCAFCRGTGLIVNNKAKMKPCNCVLRSIFRICYNRFVAETTADERLATSTGVALRVAQGGEGPKNRQYGRPFEEFVADFYLVSRRALLEGENGELDWEIFRFHFLLGADYRLCCRRLNLERGEFFHSVYRIQATLGRAFKELEPYALFPLDEYFASGRRNDAKWDENLDIDFEDPEDEPRRRVPVPIRSNA